ncbi:hypothetical protein [Mongoliitalea daihaiensis]|uniref:hypothetical protein n=1 Tax=Mongoliitalea daihaiensis TaxID=2782006 RepID=UPI001F2F01BB|nr:hypothetical protein [Mongoliitalea daihaiensis]UJP64050.1 hypothetical protein IPZ59_14650 [Mongoliitalea daihaiensis]
MANVRFTCEEKKGPKSCDAPKGEFSLGNITGVMCERCFGVVSYTVHKEEKESKPKKTAKASTPKAAKAVVNEVHEPVETGFDPVEQTETVEAVEAVEVETVQQEPVKAESKSSISRVEELLKEGKTTVEIIKHLKTEFGMTSREASDFYRINFYEKQKQEEEANDVEEAPVVPAPLPEKEAKEREASAVKPPVVTTQIETKSEPQERDFTIVGIDLNDEDTSYGVHLVTEHGIEFVFKHKVAPEKYEQGKNHASLLVGSFFCLSFTKQNEDGIPLDPVFLRFKKATATT